VGLRIARDNDWTAPSADQTDRGAAAGSADSTNQQVGSGSASYAGSASTKASAVDDSTDATGPAAEKDEAK
jgi:hypothetical protein